MTKQNKPPAPNEPNQAVHPTMRNYVPQKTLQPNRHRPSLFRKRKTNPTFRRNRSEARRAFPIRYSAVDPTRYLSTERYAATGRPVMVDTL